MWRVIGDGRYVRNIIEKAKMTQAIRLLAKDYESLSPGKAENRLFDMICHTLFSALILGVQMHLLDRIDKEDCTRWSFFASPGILHYG